MATATASADFAPRRWRLRLPERLPGLKGKWLTLYTILWAIMLPLSILGATRGAYIILTNPTMWSPYGFGTTEDSRGLYVEFVAFADIRSRGLEPGDYIVAIDGWTVPQTAARAAARPRVIKPDGSFTTFTIRKPDGRLAEIELMRSQEIEHRRFRDAGVSFPLARAFHFVTSLLVPALYVFAAILLFIRCRRDAVPAALSLSFLLFASVMNGGEQLGIGILSVQAVNSAAYLLFYGALFAFPLGRFEPRWTAVPFLLLIIVVFGEWVFPIVLMDFPSGMIFSFLVLAALISRYRKVGPGAERLQLRWAFLGLVIGMACVTLNTTLGWIGTTLDASDPRWSAWQYAFGPLLGMLSFTAITLGLIVSILRYRLYDADTVIGRSAAYGMLTAGFVVLFAASQKIIELMGEEYFGRSVGALAGGIGAALAAVAIAPMHARAQRWAERRFQRALYRLRNGLPLLAGDLRETSGVEQIAAATLDAVMDGVHTSRAAMIANGALVDARGIQAAGADDWWRAWTPTAHDGMDCDKADPVFPVRVPLEAEGHGRVGWLLLGARPDGSLFGKTERDVIEDIAEPVARAVQVALRREEREAAYRQSFNEIERRIDSIERMLATPVKVQTRPTTSG